jgi:hypothetical protein
MYGFYKQFLENQIALAITKGLYSTKITTIMYITNAC